MRLRTDPKQSKEIFPYLSIEVREGQFRQAKPSLFYYEAVMSKIRFVIVGSGWRSLYYVRIAKALPELFSLEALLCRTKEKADRLAAEWGIHTTLSAEECAKLNPDFVVIAVDKNSLATVSMEWMTRGFTVLQETPAAMDLETLNALWNAHQQGAKLVIAEQYTRYASYAAMLKLAESGLIGERDYLYLSAAHEYHGASLMRAFLGVSPDVPFSVSAQGFEFPVTETLSRYQRYTNGEMNDSNRTVALFRWENGKTALYDFDSEQYRSPIRNNQIRLQGRKGELSDRAIDYLDGDYHPIHLDIHTQTRTVKTTEENPNFSTYPEITEISVGSETLYQPPFDLAGLSEDETAIAELMCGTAAYVRDEGESPYPLRDALQDAYMAILLRVALKSGTCEKSEPQVWQYSN